jgi:hypothetical protein
MFWVRLHGRKADGNLGIEQIPTPFPTIDAAIEKAEMLIENSVFHWGKATCFTITDESNSVVLRGAIHV